jgi:concanavalin A-like lectin/glucanase superfamily protein
MKLTISAFCFLLSALLLPAQSFSRTAAFLGASVPKATISGWNPPVKSGLIAAYEPRFGAYTTISPDVQATNGQSVTRLPDLSGTGNNANQATSAKEPLYKASDFSTYDGMTCKNAATASIMTCASDIIGTSAFTICAKVKINSAASNVRLVDTVNLVVYIAGSGTQIAVIRDSATQATFTGITTGTFYNFAITASSASPSLCNSYTNGVAMGGTSNQSAGNPTAGASFSLFNRAVEDRGFDGEIIYFYIYNRVLTGGEIASMNSYIP